MVRPHRKAARLLLWKFGTQVLHALPLRKSLLLDVRAEVLPRLIHSSFPIASVGGITVESSAWGSSASRSGEAGHYDAERRRDANCGRRSTVQQGHSQVLPRNRKKVWNLPARLRVFVVLRIRKREYKPSRARNLCRPGTPQRGRELSRIWAAIRKDGSRIVSIKRAKSFEAALGHALKYPSKFFNAAPARLVELEVAFDRVRRVHALAAFYNPQIEREPGEEGPAEVGHCPICGDLLLDAPGYHFISDLRSEGRRDAATVRADVSRAKVFAVESPP
jgi:hypothetical protein